MEIDASEDFCYVCELFILIPVNELLVKCFITLLVVSHSAFIHVINVCRENDDLSRSFQLV